MGIELGDRFVANLAAVAHEAFDEETVLINFERGTYFSLRGAAPAIWTLIQTPATVAEVAAGLAASAGPLPDGAEADIAAALDRLHQEGCVATAGPTDGPREAATIAAGPYAPPVVEAFHDLKELITIDPVHETHEFAGWPVRPPSYAVEP
ncbi:MAG: PqqD family protein [Proteobacteria bacterium]|nr:PqqD family protein [Pseudomonadota bacterium]